MPNNRLSELKIYEFCHAVNSYSFLFVEYKIFNKHFRGLNYQAPSTKLFGNNERVFCSRIHWAVLDFKYGSYPLCIVNIETYSIFLVIIVYVSIVEE